MSLIQTVVGSANGTLAIPFSSNLTAGNTIIVSATGNGSISSVSDNQLNTYTNNFIGTYRNNGAGLFSYATNIVGGAGTVTIKNTGNNGMVGMIREYSNFLSPLPFDVSVVGSSTSSLGTIFAGTTTNTSVASEVAIATGWTAGGGGTATWTYDVLYTNGSAGSIASSSFMVAMEDRTLSSTGQQVGTFKQTNLGIFGWGAALMVFKSSLFATANLIQSSGTAVLGLGSTSVTWGANTTTGNTIIVGIALTNAALLGTVTSITDNQSNVYTKAVSSSISSVGDVLGCELWYATNIVGGAGSVTVNHVVDNCAMFAREYSGLYYLVDGTSAASGSSTAPNTGTIASLSQNNELVIVATADDKGGAQTWTAAGAYGDMVGTATTITGISMEDNIVNTGGAQTGTLTLGAAANWDSLCATFMRVANPRLIPQGAGV